MTPGEITFNILTIVAIFSGPIVAVRITRYLDNQRQKQEQRMDVFKTLMRTRRVTLSLDHVVALNLVEIEFKDEVPVIAAWREYFKDLAERWPADLKLDELHDREQKRSALLTKLLHAIATCIRL